MQADIEIHSAAKLPIRHLRRDGGTGARSALNKWLLCSSANCPSDNSVSFKLMVCSKMAWLALEKSPAPRFTDKLSIPCCNLSPDRDYVWPAFNCHAFKSIVIHIHALCLCRNKSFVGRIIN